MRHQLVITAPIDGVTNDQPITRVLDANVYVRPCDGGLMLGGYESEPLMPEPPPRDVDALTLDRRVIDRFIAEVAEIFPILATAPVRIFRGGLPTMTIDDEHIVGPLPELPGFFIIGGCNVGGLSAAPALGEALAAMVLAPERASELAPLLPGRFAGANLAPTAVLAACRAHYAQHYWSSAARATG